jgi:excisionase family DNA binding protein
MSKLVVVDLDELDARIEGAVARALEHHRAPESDWMTPREASAYTRLGAATLRAWVRRGILPPHPPGGPARYHRADLDRALKAGGGERKLRAV